MKYLVDTEKKLEEKINYFRSELEKAYEQEKDFNHPNVYKWSLELDKLIIKYQKLMALKKR